MATENVPQEQTANQADSTQTADSAAASVQNDNAAATENNTSDQSDSDSEKDSTASQETKATATDEKKSGAASSSESGESKVVAELKTVRKRAQTAEQELRSVRARLETLEKGQTGQQQTQTQAPKSNAGKSPSNDGPPVINDFDNYDDFVEAKVVYRLKQERRIEEQQNQEKVEQQRQQQLDKSFSKKVNKFSEEYPDYVDVVSDAPFDLKQSVLDAIKESEVGPAIAYHLAKNPDEAEKISQMSTSGAIRAIGKLETKFEVTPQKATKKQVTQAPEPIKPVGNLSTPEKKELDKVPMNEYVKVRNEQMLSKRNPAPR